MRIEELTNRINREGPPYPPGHRGMLMLEQDERFRAENARELEWLLTSDENRAAWNEYMSRFRNQVMASDDPDTWTARKPEGFPR